jgi:DUF4097 and DUF4098 domain-containing protein YvlB
MRLNPSIAAMLFAALLLFGSAASVSAQKTESKGKEAAQDVCDEEEESAEQGSELLLPATETVNVSLMTGAGRISVRGWERKEVRVQSSQVGSRIEVHKAAGPDTKMPASRLDLMVLDKSGDEDEDYGPQDTVSDVTLNVPRGATVFLKTQEGDIEVEDVMEAHLETINGRIEARRVLKATDATSVGGNVSLESATGRARLNSLNGVIEVKDLRPLAGSDFLKIRTVSGDILLDGIGPAHVEASTISGELRLAGPLVRGGRYDLTTTNGDVTILAPADASFNLNARVSEGGEIITDFQLKYKEPGPTSHTPTHGGRLQGTHGTGDATINLISFSGTLRLRKL